jgi:hypothetical protein
MKKAGEYTPSTINLSTTRWASRTGGETEVTHDYRILLLQGGEVLDWIDLPGTQVSTIPEAFEVTPGIPVQVWYDYTDDGGDTYKDPTYVGKSQLNPAFRFWAESDSEAQYHDYNDANILLSG